MDDGEQNHTEYRRSDLAPSLPQFISLIKEDLLPKIIKEDDPKKRNKLGKVIAERLHQLNSIVRSRTLVTEQTRRDIMKVVAPSFKWDKFRGNLLHEKGTDKFLKYEQDMDEKVTAGVRRHACEIETDKQDLHEALIRRDSIRKEVEKHNRPQSQNKAREVNSNTERITMLETLIKKQDEEINVLQKQLSEEHTNYVHILKSEYNDVIEELRPYVKQFGGLTGLSQVKKRSEKLKVQSQCYTLSKSLSGNVAVLLEQMLKMKERVEQTIGKLKDMEKQKEVCLKLFDHSYNDEEELDDEILVEVIMQKKKDWKETEKHLKSEIKSLRQNMEVLAETNRQLLLDLEKATQEPPKPEPVKVITPRIRRSSAPIKIIKPREEPKKASISGVAPKLISFGDCPDSPLTAMTRKKSSVARPMKTTY